ncbi:TPA: hypothetical protein R5S02_001712 [Salmonella enterica]|nr:hypothetical protein [Salmonella enterica]
MKLLHPLIVISLFVSGCSLVNKDSRQEISLSDVQSKIDDVMQKSPSRIEKYAQIQPDNIKKDCRLAFTSSDIPASVEWYGRCERGQASGLGMYFIPYKKIVAFVNATTNGEHDVTYAMADGINKRTLVGTGDKHGETFTVTAVGSEMYYHTLIGGFIKSDESSYHAYAKNIISGEEREQFSPASNTYSITVDKLNDPTLAINKIISIQSKSWGGSSYSMTVYNNGALSFKTPNDLTDYVPSTDLAAYFSSLENKAHISSLDNVIHQKEIKANNVIAPLIKLYCSPEYENKGFNFFCENKMFNDEKTNFSEYKLAIENARRDRLQAIKQQEDLDYQNKILAAQDLQNELNDISALGDSVSQLGTTVLKASQSSPRQQVTPIGLPKTGVTTCQSMSGLEYCAPH